MNKHKPCNCKAYNFPHRLDSRTCRILYNNEYEDEINEIAKDFIREEAAAMNKELEILKNGRI